LDWDRHVLLTYELVLLLTRPTDVKLFVGLKIKYRIDMNSI